MPYNVTLRHGGLNLDDVTSWTWVGWQEEIEPSGRRVRRIAPVVDMMRSDGDLALGSFEAHQYVTVHTRNNFDQTLYHEDDIKAFLEAWKYYESPRMDFMGIEPREAIR